EVKFRIQDMPYDLLARHQLRDLLRAAVKVLITVGELGPALVGMTVDVPRPPSTNVVDGVEHFVRRLVHGERRGVVLGGHDQLLLLLSSLRSGHCWDSSRSPSRRARADASQQGRTRLLDASSGFLDRLARIGEAHAKGWRKAAILTREHDDIGRIEKV